jgi:hypothetical protein
MKIGYAPLCGATYSAIHLYTSPTDILEFRLSDFVTRKLIQEAVDGMDYTKSPREEIVYNIDVIIESLKNLRQNLNYHRTTLSM